MVRWRAVLLTSGFIWDSKENRESIHRADHKRALSLRTGGFRVDPQTPEANVQDCRLGGRPRDEPIEMLHRRVTLTCNKRKGPAAIDRKENFRLTHRQVHVRKSRRPFHPYNLSRPQNLTRSGRNQFGTVVSPPLRECGSRRLRSQRKCQRKQC